MKWLSLLYAASENLGRQKLRTSVVILSLVCVLIPFLTGFAILEGVRRQAVLSVQKGADVYVTMDMFGRNGMIPYGVAGAIEKIKGVEKAVPRIIGRIYIKNRVGVILGMPSWWIEKYGDIRLVKGKIPGENEVVVGSSLAKALNISVGDTISLGIKVVAVIEHRPYIQRKVFTVSGIFDSDIAIWTADLIFMNFEDALNIFEMEDLASDIAVYVEKGKTSYVAEEIQKLNAFLRIQTKALAENMVERGFSKRGGIFILLYCFAFAMGIPLIVVVSGIGLSERRREIGILKATGWKTTDVLTLVFFENLLFSFISVPLSLILSFIWVKLFNGFLIARIFISEIASLPAFRVPADFLPIPLVTTGIVCVTLTLVGSIYTTWKTSIIPPSEAMK